MKLQQVKLLPITLELTQPFQSAHATVTDRPITLVAVQDQSGTWGYGELEAFASPTYSPETQASARVILTHDLIPLLADQTLTHPDEVADHFAPIQGNQMAKAALETAVWDLFAKRAHQSLAQMLAQQLHSSARDWIPVGISVSAQQDEAALTQSIQAAVNQGYQRIKVKTRSDDELATLVRVRRQFPTVTMMIDANASFSRANWAGLLSLNADDWAMIEQPLATTDFVAHARLQSQLKVPICLDETISSLADVQTAHALRSARAINLKLSHVGGLTEALKIIDYCTRNNLLVWCGGMLEGGIGRATNLALASLAPLPFPGDLSASDRYYPFDGIAETFALENGGLRVPTADGLGVTLAPRIEQQLLARPNLLVSQRV